MWHSGLINTWLPFAFIWLDTTESKCEWTYWHNLADSYLYLSLRIVAALAWRKWKNIRIYLPALIWHPFTSQATQTSTSQWSTWLAMKRLMRAKGQPWVGTDSHLVTIQDVLPGTYVLNHLLSEDFSLIPLQIQKTSLAASFYCKGAWSVCFSTTSEVSWI